jgi:N-acetyl-anhydromuramyl-L-alanine amidase AmpD
MIIIHWTASPSLGSALQEFYPATVSLSRRQLREAGKVNVSAHFLVDKDGTVYQLMPVTWMARHAIGLNPLAIGIENVGGGKQPLTQQQLSSDAWLITHLKSEFEGIHYLIGHNEYLRFRGTPLWRERDNSYFDFKPDPGEPFMQGLRSKVANLNLAKSFDGYVPQASKKTPFSCN